MALPAPSSTFTIPSLHDDLELDCRIYYPRSSEKNRASLGRTFAILAHPYAPLGGSYDDPVTGVAGTVLLKKGFTLGTFNFRGAPGSAGRTSWSGKAELGDYVAFYGFMLCYMDFVVGEPSRGDAETPDHRPPPWLILGGYSYGSLITSCLPPQELVSALFQQARNGSTESEIKQRAEKLGRDLVGYIEMHEAGKLDRGRSSLRAIDALSSSPRAVAAGGYESEAASRRISRESSRKSLDAETVRRSIDRARQRLTSRPTRDQDVGVRRTPSSGNSSHLLRPSVAYLLISPILPPIAAFTTMFTKPAFQRRDQQSQKITVRDQSSKDEKFKTAPACLIFGSQDVFTSSKRLQKWSQGLQSQAKSTLYSHEIEGAGHFWTEADAPDRLQASIAKWLLSLEHQGSQDA